MEYKIFGKHVVARMDKGEEIISCVEKIAEAENIKLGKISAIGAVNDVKIGLFLTEEKQYTSNVYKGEYEIVSFSGNLSTMDGKPYVHTHICIGDVKQQCFGGHCNHAYVSATCELFIDIIDGEIDRELSKEIGLNLIKYL